MEPKLPSDDVTDDLLKQVIAELQHLRTQADGHRREQAEQLSRHEVGLQQINETLQDHGAQLKAINTTLEAHGEQFREIGATLADFRMEITELRKDVEIFREDVLKLPDQFGEVIDEKLGELRGSQELQGAVLALTRDVGDLRIRTQRLERRAPLPEPPDDKGEKS